MHDLPPVPPNAAQAEWDGSAPKPAEASDCARGRRSEWRRGEDSLTV
jgi:hypothetical protein